MGWTPDLPDGTPHDVNGWTYDPEPYNGNAWYGDDGRVAVHVQPSIGRETATAKVHDERVNWGGKQYLTAPDFVDDLADAQLNDRLPADPEPGDPSYEAAVEIAVEWMRAHDAADWRHPRVREQVFDTPSDWTLEMYQLSERRTDVTYRIEDPPGPARAVDLELESYTTTHNLTAVWYPDEGPGVMERDERDLEADEPEAALLEMREVAVDIHAGEPRDTPSSGQAQLEQFGPAEAPNP